MHHLNNGWITWKNHIAKYMGKGWTLEEIRDLTHLPQEIYNYGIIQCQEEIYKWSKTHLFDLIAQYGKGLEWIVKHGKTKLTEGMLAYLRQGHHFGKYLKL